MAHLKFDLAKLEKLNDEGRFESIKPDVIWAAIGMPEPHVIIDIGAGTGLFAARFARMAPSATVYAADLEPTMVEWLTANRPEVAQGRIVPLLAEETRVPLEEGVADVVLMINLHHELADPPASYREALRLLRPGGRLAVVDWLDADTPKGPPRHVRVSAEHIAGMLRDAGFSEVAAWAGLEWHSLVTATDPT